MVFQRPREVYEHDVNDDIDPAVPSVPGVLIDEDEDDSDYTQGSESDSSGESSSSAESSSSSSDDEGDDPVSADPGVSIWVDDQTSKWNAAKFASKCNIEFDAFVAMQKMIALVNLVQVQFFNLVHAEHHMAVSYTHLTLPTIYSV